MTPTLKEVPPRKLIGLWLEMSLGNDRTPELWRNFMPRRREIGNSLTTDLISMQVYEPGFDIRNLTMDTRFRKWAAVEVSDFEVVPEGMETFELPGGLYAVFPHRGAAQTGPAAFRYIFGTWLPASGFVPDDRPQFELLGEKYKNNDPESEEEIWIPVRPKPGR
ncbi:GyrI-like domain-containing protein [Larkinella soli]|uniref:GyrI-like domain-containing protein n=1 Tax=Larkinella soli TaxID=1770527 RepID=UPI000FFB846A|nr:GyrI-like domain-containing protein [Larkinella soli]